jgi:hypothetical protein
MGKMAGNRERGFSMTARIFLVLGLTALALGACSSSGMNRMDPQQSAFYLDGTSPAPEPSASARRVSTRRAAPVTADDARAQDISGGGGNTIGRAAGPRREPAQKPFSDEWWEQEKREDARLKQKMNICRGC